MFVVVNHFFFFGLEIPQNVEHNFKSYMFNVWYWLRGGGGEGRTVIVDSE